MKQSLFTTLDTSLMGAAQHGTDKPYRKRIYDATIDITTNDVQITIDLGCEEDEEYTEDLFFAIPHDDFREWLEANEELTIDDDITVMEWDGPTRQYAPAQIAYVDYLREYLTGEKAIEYLKEKKHILDYPLADDF